MERNRLFLYFLEDKGMFRSFDQIVSWEKKMLYFKLKFDRLTKIVNNLRIDRVYFNKNMVSHYVTYFNC